MMLRDTDGGADPSLAPVATTRASAAPVALAAESAALVSRAVGVSKAENTRRAYVSD
ncbi:hypothetical protein [Rhodococcus sp. BE178]|uniref:hypothetical protein n=1 Tax=Rhodococcus sp. BE178 TaxID=2817737 RepID=UPI003D1A6DDE